MGRTLQLGYAQVEENKLADLSVSSEVDGPRRILGNGCMIPTS
jgi:hypothetical protein